MRYYRSYNASFFEPARYTARVPDIDVNRVKTCADSAELGYPGIAELYFEKTGDAGGVVQSGGSRILDCLWDRWWLAPACRGNVSKCVPLIMPNTAWGMPEMMQQAFWHNMPVAFATAVDGDFVTLNRELRSLLYAWVPETTFFLDNPSLVIFPEHSPSEYQNNIYKTQNSETLLTKWAAAGFQEVAERPFKIAQNVQFTFEQIMGILWRHVYSGSPDPWETACAWMKEEEALWQAWIPNETECTAGRGLIDSDGNFVQDRALAVNCQFCPAGSYSAEQGSTRVCKACEPGTKQGIPGESECLPCELGTMALVEGSRECESCQLGQYANQTRMSQCQ